MQLTVIVKTGKKFHFNIAFAWMVREQLNLMPMFSSEPVTGYTLIRNDGTVKDTDIN